jgi:putative membrane protein
VIPRNEGPLDPRNQALKDPLQKLSGNVFDREYMSAMIRDHSQDVARFRAESKSAQFADVKQYASSSLPTLEDHLKLARTTDRAVVGSV